MSWWTDTRDKFEATISGRVGNAITSAADTPIPPTTTAASTPKPSPSFLNSPAMPLILVGLGIVALIFVARKG